MATECAIDGCYRKHEARGWCGMHWKRWRRYGNPLMTVRDRYATPEESFAARTLMLPSGCLEWTGVRYGNGYGEINIPGGKDLAHRYAWSRANGPIPVGVDVDHTCHNRACVNVEHLRLATRTQNNRNYSGARRDNLSTGIRGVSVSKRGHITGRVYPGGGECLSKSFPTVEAATEWVREMRAEIYGEFRGGG